MTLTMPSPGTGRTSALGYEAVTFASDRMRLLTASRTDRSSAIFVGLILTDGRDRATSYAPACRGPIPPTPYPGDHHFDIWQQIFCS